jgi:hypothetical protein
LPSAAACPGVVAELLLSAGLQPPALPTRLLPASLPTPANRNPAGLSCMSTGPWPCSCSTADCASAADCRSGHFVSSCSCCCRLPKLAFQRSDNSLACTACAAVSPAAERLSALLLILLDPASEPPPQLRPPCWSLALPAEPSDSSGTSWPPESRYWPSSGCGVSGVGSSSGGSGTDGMSSRARSRAASMAGRKTGRAMSCCTEGRLSGFLHSILQRQACITHAPC